MDLFSVVYQMPTQYLFSSQLPLIHSSVTYSYNSFSEKKYQKILYWYEVNE